MNITFYGQSCFLIEMNGKKLLTDPFISANSKAKHIDVDSLKVDYVLLSHGHEDHVADAGRIAQKSGAKIISNYEVVTWYGKKGIEGHPMNHGGKWKFDFGTVKYVYATHSSVLPDGTYGGNPGGFVIWDDSNCFYFAGDTGLTMDMQTIPMTCPKLDFCIFPIGDNFTMGYEDAAIAAEFVNCDQVIGCHFDTFGYIEIDHDAAQEAFQKRGKNLIIPSIGERVQGY